MPPASLDAFLENLHRSRALTAEQWDKFNRQLAGRDLKPERLAEELVKKGWLSKFQADEVLAGRAAGLVLGSYVLLDRLGSGGMGEVYLARHQMMKRTVALKVLRSGGGGQAILRFHKEIEAAAALSHPHIVTAHDAGRVGDGFFFAMEHLRGANLQAVVRRQGALPVASACSLVRQAALGLQHAFEKGLVHRDVKPANIFVQEGGLTAKVLDLGLVRASGAEPGGRALTQLGGVVGTPDYMAPEQVVNSSAVDTRADVYALGCTLYFALSGKPPFPGGSLAEKMDRHLREEPAAIRGLRPEVPEGLAAVLRRAIAKKPEARYQTPGELARALEPFCAGAVVVDVSGSDNGSGMETTALPAAIPCEGALTPPVAVTVPVAAVAGTEGGLRRRGWRWLVAALVLLLVVGGVWLGLRGDKRKKGPSPEVANTSDDEELRRRLEARKNPPPPALEDLVFGKPLSVKFDPAPLDALDPAKIPAAERFDWQPQGLVGLFGEHRLRGSLLAVHPDGKLLATAVWPAMFAVLFPNRSGEFVLLGDTETLHFQRALDMRAKVTDLAFAPDGTLAAGCDDGTVRLLDVSGGKEIGRLEGHEGNVVSLAFSPKGEVLLAAAGRDIHVWDFARRQRLQKLTGHGGPVRAVAVSPRYPQDARAISGGAPPDGTFRVWDLEKGRELAKLDFDAVKLPRTADVCAVAFSPDGKEALTGHAGQSEARRWDLGRLERDKPLARYRLVKEPAYTPAAIAVTAEGNVLVGCSYYHTPLFLFEPEGKQIAAIHAYPWGVERLAILTGGKTVLTAAQTSHVSALHRFDLTMRAEVRPALEPLGAVTNVALSPDGRHLAADGFFGKTLLWDLLNPGSRPAESPGDYGCRRSLCFSGDARRLFSAFFLYQVSPCKEEARLPADCQFRPWDLELSRDGGYLFVSYPIGGAFLCRLSPCRKVRHLAPEKVGHTPALALCPQASYLALTACEGVPTRLWDLRTEKELHFWQTNCLPRFKPDGKAVFLGANPTPVWDVQASPPREKEALPVDSGNAASAAFSADGKRLALSFRNGSAAVWDTAGKKVWEWTPPPWLQVRAVDLAPDGRHVLLANDNGTIYVVRLTASNP